MLIKQNKPGHLEDVDNFFFFFGISFLLRNSNVAVFWEKWGDICVNFGAFKQKSVLIWTKYKGAGLGKQEWGKYDLFNMFATDKQIVRGLVANESQQKELDDKLVKRSKIIKTSEDKRRASETEDKIAKQRLPKEGLVVADLKGQTLDAAKEWATKWGWKETITKAYFNDADWYIYRHKKTLIPLIN